MAGPVFNIVKKERDQIATELTNAQAYLTKATDEKQACQQKVNNLQSKLDVFNAWLLANP